MFSVQQKAEETKLKSDGMSKNDFNIVNVRVTFKNLPIYKMEKFAFKDITAACESFKKIPGISECVIIQTNSRVEVFTVNNLEQGEVPDARRTEGKNLTINKIKETWSSLTQLEQYDLDHLDQILEVYMDADVYHHLLRLASGLESIVVGDEKIFDDIKASIAGAKLAKVSGRILNKLFDSTIRIATRIRETTGISKGIISVGEIAVKTAEDYAGLDGKKHVLIVGTGETAAMVAKTLNKRGYAFDVCSMTIERATGFSKNLGGKPVKFEDVLAGFDKFDIIFVATTADYFLITYDRIRIVMENKKKGTMILDISDPRAVDEKVSTLPATKLMFRDQIIEAEERHLLERKEKVRAVEKMLGKEVAVLDATVKRLEPEPLVKDVFSTVDSIRRKELEKALQMLGETDEEKIKILDELTKAVVENIISIPASNSKKSEE
jgi:glutamyl-tRNA reductase